MRRHTTRRRFGCLADLPGATAGVKGDLR